MKYAVLIGCFLLLAGCATSAVRMNDLRPGMTKAEVVNILGTPSSTSSDGTSEYLNYILDPGGLYPMTPYYVKITDGRVTHYGRQGDFGRRRSDVELTIKKDQTSK